MNQQLREAVSHGTEEYPFALYKMRNVKHAFSTPLHWHDELEIVYIESGMLYLTIGTESYTGKAGDIFMVNGKEIHSMYFDSLDTNYLTILFSLSSLMFLNMDKSSKDFLMPLNEQKITLVHALSGTPVYSEIKSGIEKILHLNSEVPPAYQLGTKVCLLEILYLLFSADLTVKQGKKTADILLSRNILTYILANYTEDIRLSSTAAQFHMSEKYFSRFFKKTFRLSFVDYINHLRVEKAAELLTHSSLSITEIAMQCGFSSSSYFNKRFKALLGVTPREYRK